MASSTEPNLTDWGLLLLDAAADDAAGFEPFAAEAVELEDAPVLAACWGLSLPVACAGLAVAVRNFVGVAL